MLRTFVFSLALMMAGCGDGTSESDSSEKPVSSLKKDEQVVFFRTAGWLDEASQEWHLPIHGWVYEPEDSSARRVAFETIIAEEFDLSSTTETESNLDERLNLLIADNERGKTMVVNLAGRDYNLPSSSENGHFEATLQVPVSDVDQYGAGAFISFSAVFDEDDSRRFEGDVRLVGPSGVSVISDIDDTVKISNVTDTKKLLEYTFLLDFEAAPGMAMRYNDWSTDDVSFHFVSSSPWQLYPPLIEFLDDASFPWATLSLKSVRFTDKTLFDLFKKGTETKPPVIEKILNAYPRREFVLVGDSGEQDPEVYAALIRNYPDQINSIYIRNVTQETPDNDRFKAVFDGIDPERWLLFDDPNELDLPSSP